MRFIFGFIATILGGVIGLLVLQVIKIKPSDYHYFGMAFSLGMNFILIILFTQTIRTHGLSHEFLFFAPRSRIQLFFRDMAIIGKKYDVVVSIIFLTIIFSGISHIKSVVQIIQNGLLLSLVGLLILGAYLLICYNSRRFDRLKNVKNLFISINTLIVLIAVFEESYELAEIIFNYFPLTGILNSSNRGVILIFLGLVSEVVLIGRVLSKWKF